MKQTPQSVAEAIQALSPDPRPKPAPTPDAVVAAGENVSMPTATVAQLIATVERLFERVDRGEAGSVELLRGVLAEHGGLLQQTLRPENRLHPDISDLNPLGERDHPRPPLKRPCFFLGMALDQPTLTLDEITLLNSVTGPLELPAKNWRIVLLRDGGGGEALHISVPFKSFDDIRSLEGGWQRVVRDLLGIGTKPQNTDSLLERIAALEAKLSTTTH